MSSKPATENSKKKSAEKRKQALVRFALTFLSFVTVTFVLVAEKAPEFGGAEFVVGEPAPRTLFSPVNLKYVNQEKTERKRQEATALVPPVVRLDTAVAESVRQKAEVIFSRLLESRQKLKAGETVPPEALELALLDEQKKFLLEEADLVEVRKYFDELLEKYLNEPKWSASEKSAFLQRGYNRLILARENGEEEIRAESIPVLEQIREAASSILRGLIPKNRRERNAALDIFDMLLASNLQVDEAATMTRRQKAAEAIPPVEEEIKRNELIVQRGMIIDQKDRRNLEEIHKALSKKVALHQFLGTGLFVLVIFLIASLYLFYFERRLMRSFRSLVLLQTVFVLTVLISKALMLWTDAPPTFMPVALASILLALLLDARVAILAGAVMAFVTAPLAGYAPEVVAASFLGSVAAVFASRRLRKRIDFLRVGFAIGMADFLVLFAFQILGEAAPREALYAGFQGLVNGFLITTPIAFLLLPVLESVFDLVTDITLLEYSDLNHPLLKRMIVEAPGTYHHSLVVSTLAESACESIGANALLARVGCYFHDIGKIARAEYFTENENRQIGSRHKKLTPTMSCLIIMNHVKEGIELGRKYKLRRPILDFIPEHQGTGIVYYFYKKALDQAAPGEVVLPDDFRYPGPKPQSRETAVALLADSTEASSRSIKDPTPESIRQAVRKIINDKFIDGQLDECNLTLRDLHKIQESFVHNLMAIFHTRVAYPDKPDPAEKVDLFREDPVVPFREKPAE